MMHKMQHWEWEDSIASTAPDIVPEYHRRHPNIMASDRQQQTTTASTKPRSRNQHATPLTTSQSSDVRQCKPTVGTITACTTTYSNCQHIGNGHAAIIHYFIIHT